MRLTGTVLAAAPAVHNRISADWLSILMYAWGAVLMFSSLAAECLAILLIIWAVFAVRPQQVLASRLMWLVFALMVVRLCSILTSMDPSVSLKALRKIPFMLIALPAAAFAARPDMHRITRLIHTLALAGAAASLLALGRLLFSGLHRIHSTTSGPATLAIYLAAVLVMILAVGIYWPNARRLWWMLAIVPFLFGMTFTYNRAPWTIAVMVGLVMGLTHSQRRWMAGLAAVAAVSFLVVPNYWWRFAALFHWPPDFGERTIIWFSGWRHAISGSILGHGPETFALLFDRRDLLADQGVGAWHSSLLQLWIESGPVALGLFLALCGLCLRHLLQLRRRHPRPCDRATVTAIAAGISVLFLTGLFGGLIGDPIIDMLFWTLVGITAGWTTVASPNHRATCTWLSLAHFEGRNAE